MHNKSINLTGIKRVLKVGSVLDGRLFHRYALLTTPGKERAVKPPAGRAMMESWLFFQGLDFLRSQACSLTGETPAPLARRRVRRSAPVASVLHFSEQGRRIDHFWILYPLSPRYSTREMQIRLFREIPQESE